MAKHLCQVQYILYIYMEKLYLVYNSISFDSYKIMTLPSWASGHINIPEQPSHILLQFYNSYSNQIINIIYNSDN